MLRSPARLVLVAVLVLGVTPAGATADPVQQWLAALRAGLIPTTCDAPRSGEPGGSEYPTDPCTSGIRPGARMTAPAGCTFNFVYTDEIDLFIGTAGHCVSGAGVRVSAQGIGQFGTVVYRVSLNESADFALIKVDPIRAPQVSPALCEWGGPTAVHSGGAARGTLIREYGWGVATSLSAETRARTLVLDRKTATSAYWDGVGSGGDSGAPLVTEDGKALAIHTQGITPVAGVVDESGPTVERILTLVHNAGFTLVRLVTVSG